MRFNACVAITEASQLEQGRKIFNAVIHGLFVVVKIQSAILIHRCFLTLRRTDESYKVAPVALIKKP